MQTMGQWELENQVSKVSSSRRYLTPFFSISVRWVRRDLAGDVPIFQILEVIDEDLFFAGWMEGDLVLLEGFDGLFGERLDVDKPLIFERGLEDGAALVAVGDRVGDVVLAAEEALVFEVFEDLFAGL